MHGRLVTLAKEFWRYPAIMVGGALAVVVIAYVFNLLVFGFIPKMQRLFSMNDALFLEGLLVLVLGAMILLRLPHAADVGGLSRRKVLAGSGLTTDAGPRKDAVGNILAFGGALVIAAIMMFLLSFWGVY